MDLNDFVARLKKRKIEVSHATGRLTAELLHSIISQQKLPPTNQDVALIQVVRGIGDRLAAANPAEFSVGDIVRRVLHVIREENLYLQTIAIEVLSLSDDEDVVVRDYNYIPSALSSGNILHPPSLYAILHNTHKSASACLSLAGNEFEEKGKAYKSSTTRKLKHHVVEAINILIEEIDTSHEQIAEQAVEHIHQKYIP